MSKLSKLNPSTVQTIVWAVDPFEQSGLPARKTAEEIRDVIRDRPARILPVYVRHRSWFEVPEMSQAQVRSLTETEIANARAKLVKRIGKLSTKQTWAPAIVVDARDGSLRAQVEALLSVARREGADLIVTPTHAKRGLDRWLLGSFAETLISRSEVPVLAVNPSVTKRRRKHRRILFATDLSAESAAAFAKLLPYARESGAEVCLFHRFSFDSVPEPGAAYSLGSLFERVTGELLRQKRATLEKWIARAAVKGVKAKAVVDVNSAATVPAILKHAERCDLIALATQSGPVAAAVAGSTTRKVLRQAKCPVWTFHARAPLVAAK